MIATSIEQSKRLLELGVDPKTADLWWNNYTITYDFGHAMEVKTDKPWLGSYNWYDREDNIPAWSLSALLKVIGETKKGLVTITRFVGLMNMSLNFRIVVYIIL